MYFMRIGWGIPSRVMDISEPVFISKPLEASCSRKSLVNLMCGFLHFISSWGRWDGAIGEGVSKMDSSWGVAFGLISLPSRLCRVVL